MNVFQPIYELKSLFPETSWSWVISALRQDDIVWQSLQDDKFRSIAIQSFGKNPTSWKPGSLALLALKTHETFQTERHPFTDMTNPPLDEMDGNLRNRVIQAYQDALKTTSPPTDLQSAGLFALGIREHGRTMGSWERIYVDVHGIPLRCLKTPFACLYALIPDPMNMIRGLVKMGAHPELILHIILSNPLLPTEQTQILKTVLNEVHISTRLYFLNFLSNHRPNLATELSQHYLSKENKKSIVEDEYPIGDPFPARNDKSTSTDFATKTINKSYTQYERIENITHNVIQAQVNHLAENNDKRAELLSKAWETSKELFETITAHLTQSLISAGKPDTALEVWTQTTGLPQNPSIENTSSLALSFIDEKEYSKAESVINSVHPLDEKNVSHIEPDYFLAKALLTAQGIDIKHARKYSLQCLEHYLQMYLNNPDHSKNRKGVSKSLISLSYLFLQIGLPADALRSSSLGLKIYPTNIKLLNSFALAASITGSSTNAIQAAHLAVAIAPKDPELRRNLAHVLYQTKNWQPALEEYLPLVDDFRLENSHSNDDLNSVVKCYIKLRNYKSADEYCQRAIQLDPDDGIAYTNLGTVYFKLGDIDSAKKFINRAIDIDPFCSQPWIQLADINKSQNEKNLALETLNSARSSAPENPNILMALGKEYLANGSLTQALTTFTEASNVLQAYPLSEKKHTDKSTGRYIYSYYDLKTNIEQLLGFANQELGHFEEAKKVLASAYQTAPEKTEIALSFGNVLLSLDRPDLAIAPLKTVIKSEPESITPYLDYARAHLLSNQDPCEAIKALKHILKVQPNHTEALAFLAEAYRAIGEYRSAMEIFNKALNTELREDHYWCARLSLGLGSVALELNQFETALSSFEIGFQADPKNLDIAQNIVQAYIINKMPEKALNAAKRALELAPDNLDNIIWYAEQTATLNVFSEAILALQRALEIAPHRADLCLNLGQAFMDAGDKPQASKMFSQVHTIKNASPLELRITSHRLIELNEPVTSLQCLERSLQLTLEAKSEKDLNDSEGLAEKPEYPSKVDLLTDLAVAHHLVGDNESALESLHKVIALDPTNYKNHLYKSDLLLHMDRSELALDCLEKTLTFSPENPEVLLRMAHIQRMKGNLYLALSFAERAVFSGDIPMEYQLEDSARMMAADLAWSILDPKYARKIMSGEVYTDGIGNSHQTRTETYRLQVLHKPNDDSFYPINVDTEKSWDQAQTREENIKDQIGDIYIPNPIANHKTDFHCLKAELAFEINEEVAAAKAITAALEESPDNPRVMALQSRIKSRSGDHQSARIILDQVIETIKRQVKEYELDRKPSEVTADDQNVSSRIEEITYNHPKHILERKLLTYCLAAGGAAMELQKWDDVVSLYKFAAVTNPLEPRTHISLAKALTNRAETKQFLQSIKVIRHAPGSSSLSQSSYKLFEQEIKTATNLMELYLKSKMKYENADMVDMNTPANIATDHPIINLWRARGQAVFEPSILHTKALSRTIQDYENIAARIAAYKEIGDGKNALKLSYSVYEDDGSRHPNHSILLAQIALALSDIDSKTSFEAAQSALEEAIKNNLSNQPVYSALFAYIAYQCEEYGTSFRSIETALMKWNNEANWHAFIAELYLHDYRKKPDLKSAIHHINQSIKLEPKQLEYYLSLGKAHLQGQNPESAIEALEKATKYDEENADIWLTLANAHRSLGHLNRADLCAKSAAELSSSQIEPHLLLAEIALDNDDHKKSNQNINVALQSISNNPKELSRVAKVLKSLNRKTDALDILEKAILHTKDPFPLQMERVHLLKEVDGNNAAILALNELIKLYPSNIQALILLAESLAEDGQYQKAIQVAQRALRAGERELEKAQHAYLHQFLGRLLRKNGQLDQAIVHLEEAVQTSPDSEEARIELGRTHLDRRQYANALNSFRQAIDMKPDKPLPYYFAGLALKDMKEYLEAEDMLRKAAKLAPNDLRIHRKLGAMVAMNLVHNHQKQPYRSIHFGADL